MNVQIDHVHLVVSIPPKVSVSELMGIMKGEVAIKKIANESKAKKYSEKDYHSTKTARKTIPIATGQAG
jgi:REP element-mobilizing transposase RayT